MFTKYASATITGYADSSKGKTASMKTCGSFEYEPRTDHKYLYVAARACTADVPNLNYDMLPDRELKDAYKTFIGSYVYLNHDNTDPAKARGAIIDAKYHTEDENDKWVEILMELDEEKAPKLCSLIRSGDIDTVSMGCSVENTECSICGNVAEYPFEYCKHIQAKGQEYGGKLAYEICNGIEFFEESFVYNPADPTAYVKGLNEETVTANKSAKRQYITAKGGGRSKQKVAAHRSFYAEALMDAEQWCEDYDGFDYETPYDCSCVRVFKDNLSLQWESASNDWNWFLRDDSGTTVGYGIMFSTIDDAYRDYTSKTASKKTAGSVSVGFPQYYVDGVSVVVCGPSPDDFDIEIDVKGGGYRVFQYHDIPISHMGPSLLTEYIYGDLESIAVDITPDISDAVAELAERWCSSRFASKKTADTMFLTDWNCDEIGYGECVWERHSVTVGEDGSQQEYNVYFDNHVEGFGAKVYYDESEQEWISCIAIDGDYVEAASESDGFFFGREEAMRWSDAELKRLSELNGVRFASKKTAQEIVGISLGSWEFFEDPDGYNKWTRMGITHYDDDGYLYDHVYFDETQEGIGAWVEYIPEEDGWQCWIERDGEIIDSDGYYRRAEDAKDWCDVYLELLISGRVAKKSSLSGIMRSRLSDYVHDAYGKDYAFSVTADGDWFISGKSDFYTDNQTFGCSNGFVNYAKEIDAVMSRYSVNKVNGWNTREPYRDMKWAKTAGLELSDMNHVFDKDMYGNPCYGCEFYSSDSLGTDCFGQDKWVLIDTYNGGWIWAYYEGDDWANGSAGSFSTPEAALNDFKSMYRIATFANDPKRPDEVETQEDERVCPLCGSESFDGEYCSICGYQEPPEGFGDIEIDDDDKVEEVEETEDDESVDEEEVAEETGEDVDEEPVDDEDGDWYFAEDDAEDDSEGDDEDDADSDDDSDEDADDKDKKKEKSAGMEIMYDIADDPQYFINVADEAGGDYILIGFDIIKTDDVDVQYALEDAGAIEM